MQPLTPVPSRTEQVYLAIRESICDCSLTPGTHLVQEDLALKLGVSRQPIQQAMLLLKNDGLVVEHGKRGLYVAPIDRETMAHHYQIRMTMDALAARLVAERVREENGFEAHLRTEGAAALEAGARACKSGDVAQAVRQDVNFHLMIYALSGNPLIASTADAHWVSLRRAMSGVLVHARRGAVVWKEHEAILAALLAGDTQASERLANDHVKDAQQALMEALENA